MSVKPYKTKLRREFIECLLPAISMLLLQNWIEDDDKLLMATLAAIGMRLADKLDTEKYEHSLKFSAADAFALRILYVNYSTMFDPYSRNRLMQIANEVHRHYS